MEIFLKQDSWEVLTIFDKSIWKSFKSLQKSDNNGLPKEF